MKNLSEYWDKRSEAEGHTGWSSFLYPLDQYLRLRHIKDCILNLQRNGDLPSEFRFLDFGCGVGDFTNLLTELGGTGIGVDISKHVILNAAEKYPKLSFYHRDRLSENNFNQLDIILAITVFQHMVEDDDLLYNIKFLSSKLKCNGLLISIDKISNSDYSLYNNNYIKIRTHSSFDKFFNELSTWKILYYKQFLLNVNEYSSILLIRLKKLSDKRIEKYLNLGITIILYKLTWILFRKFIIFLFYILAIVLYIFSHIINFENFSNKLPTYYLTSIRVKR